MKRDIALQIYAYCVCAVALAVAVIFFCAGVYGIVKIAAPGFTVPQHEWANIATFQSFKTDWQKTQGAVQLTDDELKMRWEDKRQIAIMAEKRGGAQNLVNMIIAFVVALPVFILHWRLARKHREQ
jgi:hypothetical protein